MEECFDTPDKLYLILDYVSGGELFDRIVEEASTWGLLLLPQSHRRAVS
jgi:hypothetical protein